MTFFRVRAPCPSPTMTAIIVVLLCLLWYSISATTNILNKMILQRFPYPLTIAMSSLFSTSLYAMPLILRGALPKHAGLSKMYWLFGIVPLALGKILVVSSAFISIWKVPVSYAHTVKATMPLFVVFCARFILHERQTCRVYMSLLPIVGGVIIASLTELSFNLVGMLSALLSTCGAAVMNTFVKKVLQDTGLHHVPLLSIIAQVATVLFFPIWCFHDVSMWVYGTSNETTAIEKQEDAWPMWYVGVCLLFSGFLHFAQNLVTFTLIHKLTALSYSVANCAKRITVIAVSLLALKNPVTSMNAFGMSLAIVGVFCYNRAKDLQKGDASHRLPITTNDSFVNLDPRIILRNGDSRASILNGWLGRRSSGGSKSHSMAGQQV